MKRCKLFLTLIFACVAGGCTTTPKDRAISDTLVWCGLDYSKVKMIGAMDFRQPNQIFPGMLYEWNGLFMKEMFPKLESMDKSVQTDMDAVRSRNEGASTNQIERIDGTAAEMVKQTHITTADISATVRSLELNHGNGIGLIFIIDRLVKAQETGCLYVVFFDIKTRRLLYFERVTGGAGGIGFRNYWFNPIKTTVQQLPKRYKKAKANQANLGNSTE